MRENTNEEALRLLGEAMECADAYYKSHGIFQDRFGFGAQIDRGVNQLGDPGDASATHESLGFTSALGQDAGEPRAHALPQVSLEGRQRKHAHHQGGGDGREQVGACARQWKS